MANSYNEYTAPGGTTDFAFTPPYLAQAHIKASLDGVEKTVGVDFNIQITPTVEVQFVAPVSAGVTVRCYRETPIASEYVTFVQGASLPASDLNNMMRQMLYLAQEDIDNPPAGGGGGGVTDHGALTGRGDDDHTQYHNDARALAWLATVGSTIKAAYEAQPSAFTDALFTLLNNQSGVNTGDKADGAIDHDALLNYVAAEHKLDAAIDHDALLNYVAAEHKLDAAIDHDALLNFLAAEHVDWAGNGTGTIHINNLPFGTAGQQLTTNEAEDAVEWSLASEYLPVRKGSAGTIAKGTPVYASGFNAGLGIVEVEEAAANVSANMPCIGLAFESITNAADARVLMAGVLDTVDTSSWSTLDRLYVSIVAGTLTDTRPIGATSAIQVVGTVLRSHATLGQIAIFGAGRSNALPQLTADSTWRGATNSIPEEVLHNLSASGAPAVTDDSDDGYAIDSVWIWTAKQLIYICVDATVGAAVWTLISGKAISGGAGVPSSVPKTAGDEYYDVAADSWYIAHGSTAAVEWKLMDSCMARGNWTFAGLSNPTLDNAKNLTLARTGTGKYRATLPSGLPNTDANGKDYEVSIQLMDGTGSGAGLHFEHLHAKTAITFDFFVRDYTGTLTDNCDEVSISVRHIN